MAGDSPINTTFVLSLDQLIVPKIASLYIREHSVEIFKL